jgi:homoserine kinase
MAILLPDVMIPTKNAREILRDNVSLQDMVRQSANLGSFIIGMHQGDLDLIRRSMRDQIIEPQRKHLIPFFEDVQSVALSQGALGCSISGAGPAIFALCQEKLMASEILKAMNAVYQRHGLEARTFIGKINHEGTVAV